MFCKECGNKLDENSLFCDKCGKESSSVNTQKRYNTLSVVGFIVACISLLLNFFGIIGISAVILSSLGFIQINKTSEKGKGMAIAGISIGAFSIIYAFILLLAMM